MKRLHGETGEEHICTKTRADFRTILEINNSQSVSHYHTPTNGAHTHMVGPLRTLDVFLSRPRNHTQD
jgi:hypothetical protein